MSSDAAMDLFGRQGYHATTVAQIEEAAGRSATVTGAPGYWGRDPVDVVAEHAA